MLVFVNVFRPLSLTPSVITVFDQTFRYLWLAHHLAISLLFPFLLSSVAQLASRNIGGPFKLVEMVFVSQAVTAQLSWDQSTSLPNICLSCPVIFLLLQSSSIPHSRASRKQPLGVGGELSVKWL